MSQDPCSIFGYGVVLKGHEYKTTVDNDHVPASPQAIYDSYQAYDGIRIVRIGTALGDEDLWLITVREAYSASPDYEPRRLEPEKVNIRSSWAKRIQDYIEEWDLKEYLQDGFQEPGFVHAPYYG